MSRLYDNLHRMSNTEINNLAKNQYTDTKIQTWIAERGHIQARYYLAEVQNLCKEAADILMSGKSRLVKSIMVSSGNITDSDVISEIYFSQKSKTPYWRAFSHFVKNWWRGLKEINSPPEVLEDIWESYYSGASPQQYRYGATRHAIALAEHKNCSLKLAIIMSTHENVEISSAGKAALVRISKSAAK